MATKYYAVLTNVGAAKLANATALGAQVEITQMAVGDGNGVLPTPNPAQTALVHELRRKPLNSLSIDPNNANQIIAEQVIPEDEGGWWIREIGLFDKDGDMIAVANCAETYKPQLQEGSGRVQVVRMILIVSSTAAVTLKIDPSVVLATRQYVDDQIIQVKSYVDQKMAAHVAAADPHKQYAPKNSLAGKMDKSANGSDIENVSVFLQNLGLGDAIGYVGRLLNTRVFTSSGTYTPTPGTKKIRVRAVGGGGGGGGVPATASGSQATAKGGESGAYVEAIITLATTADIIVTIGTGGAGGAVGYNTGVDGGATTLGSLLTCPGGKGGEGGATSTTNFITSDASSQMAPTTTGTIVSALGTCRPSLGRVGLANAASVGGAGGSSMLGFGGGGGTANSASRIESVRGAGFGAGGGGGSSCVGSAAMAGAAGTSGAIFIEEFA